MNSLKKIYIKNIKKIILTLTLTINFFSCGDKASFHMNSNAGNNNGHRRRYGHRHRHGKRTTVFGFLNDKFYEEKKTQPIKNLKNVAEISNLSYEDKEKLKKALNVKFNKKLSELSYINPINFNNIKTYNINNRKKFIKELSLDLNDIYSKQFLLFINLDNKQIIKIKVSDLKNNLKQIDEFIKAIYPPEKSKKNKYPLLVLHTSIDAFYENYFPNREDDFGIYFNDGDDEMDEEYHCPNQQIQGINHINGVKGGENDEIFLFDSNLDNQHDEYRPDVDTVAAYIKQEQQRLFDAILAPDFDDIYAPSDDNILIEEEKQNKGKKINNNQTTLDDGNDEQDEYEYDEQKEGHIEEIDNKKIIFPREYKNIGPVFSYGKDWGKDWEEEMEPKYKHLKEEVLNNKFAPITEKTWNGILKKCSKILKGEFSSKRKNRWAKLLRDNKIHMKHLVALKLYTDFDLLQREFRKSFRAPWNKNLERLQAFYWWRKALKETFTKFTHIQSLLHQPDTLFHGVNSIMCIDQYDGIYFGPCSTTTDLHVARSFAGKNGMILVIRPERNPRSTKFRVLDISWISDYPDEREYLLLDHKILIETWILSSDYDQYYHFYHNTLTKRKVINAPIGHLSYAKQKKIGRQLTKLKTLIDEVEIKPKKNDQPKLFDVSKKKKPMRKFKQNIEFKKDSLKDNEKIDLLVWMFEFALSYKYGKTKPTKYDQSLNANIQHVMKQIHTMQVPPKIVTEFMEELRRKYEKELSAYFIRSVLNEFFINTYVPLDAA